MNATDSTEERATARLTDFKSPQAMMLTERLAAEARMNESLATVLAAEERLAGGLAEVLDRVDQAIERTERVEASVSLATDLLQQQARLIATMFRDQVTKTEIDGTVTLRGHVLELGDHAAMLATSAMNSVAEDAAAVAGVKAEVAAIRRVTEVIVDLAKASGLDESVRVLVAACGRIDESIGRVQEAVQKPVEPVSVEPQPPVRTSLGAGPLAWLWLTHHLGKPGLAVAAAVVAFGAYKTFG